MACGPRSDLAVRADSLSATPKVAAGDTGQRADSSRPAPAPGGVLGRYDLAGEPAWQVRLPKDLDEISGLAFSPDGRLFGHGDQDATIWQLDARNGKRLKTFSVASSDHDPDLGKKGGNGTLTGDFEDIQIVGDRFFLISSNGVLIEFREGADGGAVPYTAHDTGLGPTCEIEGLAHEPASRSLLILCKIPHQDAYKDQIVIFAWSLDRARDRHDAPDPGRLLEAERHRRREVPRIRAGARARRQVAGARRRPAGGLCGAVAQWGSAVVGWARPEVPPAAGRPRLCPGRDPPRERRRRREAGHGQRVYAAPLTLD